MKSMQPRDCSICKQGAVRFYSSGLLVLVLAYISPLDSSGSWCKAETELCKHLVATALLSSLSLLVWMQSGFPEHPYLPSYSSLASSLHLQVKSPVGSRPQMGSAPRLRLHLHLHLHLSVWLSLSASCRSTDHYRYQALFPLQNDISAFDPTPKLIFVHFWAF